MYSAVPTYPQSLIFLTLDTLVVLIIKDDEKVICVDLEQTAPLRQAYGTEYRNMTSGCWPQAPLDMGDCCEQECCILNEF